MAAIIEFFKNLPDTPLGAVLSVVGYTLMLMLVLAFFTGHGAFIYEGF